MDNEKFRDKRRTPIYTDQPTNLAKIEDKRIDLSFATDARKAARTLASVNINLRISQGSAASRVLFSGHVSDRDFRPLPLALKDLEDFYERIHSLVGSLEATKHSAGLTSRLAEEGWLLYKRLFSAEEQTLFSEFRDGYLIESATANPPESIRPLSVLVKSRGLHVPWEFLYTECPYDANDDVCSIDERYFFGYWAFVRQDVTPALDTRARERSLHRDAIRIFFDDNLAVASTIEAPSIQKIFQSRGYRASIASALDSNQMGRALLSDIDANPTSLVHFACHSESPRGSAPSITVYKDYKFTSEELRLSGRRFRMEPVAFVNSCEMALMEMERYCNFVGYFFDRGFSALLATEIRISDHAAWDFASRVYENLFLHDHGSLVLAVFSARRQMLFELGSLVGFTYCYYGLIDIVPASTTE